MNDLGIEENQARTVWDIMKNRLTDQQQIIMKEMIWSAQGYPEKVSFPRTKDVDNWDEIASGDNGLEKCDLFLALLSETDKEAGYVIEEIANGNVSVFELADRLNDVTGNLYRLNVIINGY